MCAPYVGIVGAALQERSEQPLAAFPAHLHLLAASPALFLAARQEHAAERDRHRRARLLRGGTRTIAKRRERRL